MRVPGLNRTGGGWRLLGSWSWERLAVGVALAAAISGLIAVATDQARPNSVPTIRVAELPADPGAATLVDLNRATAAELEALPLIGPGLAAAIIRARSERPLRSVDDLVRRGVLRIEQARQLQSVATVYVDVAAE